MYHLRVAGYLFCLAELLQLVLIKVLAYCANLPNMTKTEFDQLGSHAPQNTIAKLIGINSGLGRAVVLQSCVCE